VCSHLGKALPSILLPAMTMPPLTDAQPNGRLTPADAR
jgi:hypothetical protein